MPAIWTIESVPAQKGMRGPCLVWQWCGRTTRGPGRRLSPRFFASGRKARMEPCALRCAVSGLRLIKGGRRPEVLAAHIMPDNGPDTVRNGIALSGTVHWLFLSRKSWKSPRCMHGLSRKTAYQQPAFW